MRNRNGQIYTFEKVNDNTFTVVGELDYWRFGGKEGQEQMDFNDLGFVDPSGGPFISVGMILEGRVINKIRAEGDNIYFEVD